MAHKKRSHKTNPRHRKAYQVMKNRARALRNRMSVSQSIALTVVSRVCKTLGLEEPRTEKPVFCPTNRHHYILDIYLPSISLAIEIDGKSHDGSEAYDATRDFHLSLKGIRVVRFRNQEVWALGFRKKVELTILDAARKATRIKWSAKFEKNGQRRAPERDVFEDQSELGWVFG